MELFNASKQMFICIIIKNRQLTSTVIITLEYKVIEKNTLFPVL